MLRSLNQIDQTSRNAARGCGLPWGVADEVGKAIRWLHAFGLDGVTGLVAVLEQYNNQTPTDYAPQSFSGIWRTPKGILNPLMSGISLCDYLGSDLARTHQSVTTEKIAHPLLTAGFLGQYLLGQALSEAQSIQLKWSAVTLDLSHHRLTVSGNQDELGIALSMQLTCTRIPISPIGRMQPIQPVIGDVVVDDVLWEKLEQYALNTCVEATEASRLSGAGAGLNDND